MKIPHTKNIAYLLLNSKFKLITMNKVAEDLLKCSVDDLEHQSIEMLLANKDQKTNFAALASEGFKTTDLFIIRLYTHVDSNVQPLQWTFHKFLQTENNINIILVTLCSDYPENVININDTCQIPEFGLESPSQGSFILDRPKQLITYNPGWLVELGYHNFESTQSLNFMLSLVSPADRDRIALILNNEKYFNTDFRMASNDGVEFRIRATGVSNVEDSVCGILKIISHPTSEVNSQGELEHVNHSDCSGSPIHQSNSVLTSIAKSISKPYHHHRFKNKHAASDLHLNLSRVDLAEMIKILLQNAVEASTENSLINIESGKQFHSHGHCVVCQKEIRGVKNYLSVKDSGHGVKKEYFPYIFKKRFSTKRIYQNDFERLHTGLYRLQQLVHSNRGHIVTETADGFSRFKIFFPESIPGKELISSSKKEKFCLMIVDDHPAVSKYLSKALDKESVQITSILSPQSALELIKQYPDQFDLIITDLNMPGLAGDQLIQAIKAVNSTLPLVLCSGENQQSLKKLASREGIFGYLNKPISVSKLIKMVNSLRTRRLQEPITGTNQSLVLKSLSLIVQCGQYMSNSAGF